LETQPKSNICKNIHVVKYGSDPLKTYLSDSDIDTTIIVNNNFWTTGGNEIFLNANSQLRLINQFLERYEQEVKDLDSDSLDLGDEAGGPAAADQPSNQGQG
jgi:hypothetical protein